MAVVVPSQDLQGTLLQNNVNNIGTLITANPNNVALINQQYDAQLKLCTYLLARGSVVSSAVLTACTYVHQVSGSPQG
jgi:hypothetical protein